MLGVHLRRDRVARHLGPANGRRSKTEIREAKNNLDRAGARRSAVVIRAERLRHVGEIRIVWVGRFGARVPYDQVVLVQIARGVDGVE